MDNVKELCNRVREVAYAIHVFLGPGHLEKVYENALVHRLRVAGLRVEQQYPVHVYDEDGTLIGSYIADLFVEEILLIELKVAHALARGHEAQVLGYLKAARVMHGLLINFGAYRFQIRKFAAPDSAWRGARPS